MKKRENDIIELLVKHGKIEVVKLAETLGVSQVTIRKDLDELEAKNVLKREHGYAVIEDLADVNKRLILHYAQKLQIAKKALELVKPGESVMIESGSCCTLLANEIASNLKGTQIVTNSAFIANYIRQREYAEVVLLGGEYQKESQVMIGPIVRTCASQFYVDKMFVGADGYIDGVGFTGVNTLRVQAVRDMADFASKVIVVTESEKFSQLGTTPLNINYKEIQVVTDSKLEKAKEKMLADAGIKVYKAKV